MSRNIKNGPRKTSWAEKAAAKRKKPNNPKISSTRDGASRPFFCTSVRLTRFTAELTLSLKSPSLQIQSMKTTAPFCYISRWKTFFTALAPLTILAASALAEPEPGFKSLFDGKTLNGWTLVGQQGEGY